MTDRGSTQHSRRLDDAMAEETASLTHGAPVESRAQEWRLMEAPADGEPPADAWMSVDAADVAVNALPLDEIEGRSRLAASLRPRAFPARREALLEVAQEEHAEPRVLAWLAALPEERVFENVQEVWDALGGRHETRTSTPPPRPAPARRTSRRDEPAPTTSAQAPNGGRVPAGAEADGERAGATRSVGALAGQAVGVTLRVLAIPVGVTHSAVRVARRWLRR